ncbi:response regulator transcription factor [Carnobacterium gallinarum]|uniref:response regulator transcription factor n=1 Tax=Carnobacterium gallinarum TaxID=2749 RepID=UPI00054DFC75|nr:response regulator transcription factor [Carnobacterium gallinarum]
MKILIVDDEPKILDVVEAYLVTYQYSVYRAETGVEALKKVQAIHPDLMILDLMLPDMDGFEVCQAVRRDSMLPIIMLTAKSGEKNVIAGLKTGADDYLVKPFSPKELVARVETVLRRTGRQEVSIKWSFNQNDLVIFPQLKEIYVKGNLINLTTTEFDLLKILAEYPTRIFAREQLIESVLGIEFAGSDRAIDSHIKNLRQKLEVDTKKPCYILTVHGMGYRFGGRA